MTNRTKGICCIVASAFGFALMASFVRLCDDYGPLLSCFQKSFFRNLIAFAIALGVFLRQRRTDPVAPVFSAADSGASAASVWGTLIARATFGTVGIFCNFYAISYIPVAEAMTLNKTAPFFTVIAAAFVLGERVTKRQLLWLVTAFAGALLVIRPGFRGEEALATVIALAGGLCAGLAYACIRQLGRLKVDFTFIVLFFSAFSCLVSVPFICFSYVPMTGAQFAILLGAGSGAALGQFGITAAYRYTEPRSIAAFDYTSVIFTAIFGLLFFAQVPDFLSVAGFAVIVLAAVRMR